MGGRRLQIHSRSRRGWLFHLGPLVVLSAPRTAGRSQASLTPRRAGLCCALSYWMVVGVCAAQGNPDAFEMNKIQAALMASLGELKESMVSTPADPPTDRTQAKSVSAAQLRHKPRKGAQKHLSRGVAFSRRRDPSHAAAEFERAIMDDPEHAEAHIRLGIEYTVLNRYMEAEAAFRRAIALDPGMEAPYYDLGILLYGMGNLEGAEQCMRRALELSSTDAQVHFLLGQLLWSHPETRVESLRHLEYAAHSIPQARQMLHEINP